MAPPRLLVRLRAASRQRAQGACVRSPSTAWARPRPDEGLLLGAACPPCSFFRRSQPNIRRRMMRRREFFHQWARAPERASRPCRHCTGLVSSLVWIVGAKKREAAAKPFTTVGEE